MEELGAKCSKLRDTLNTSGLYEDNDIFVILSDKNNENSQRSHCSTLFITAIEKLRQAAGVLRSSNEPNIILVSHKNEVPITSEDFLYWENPVFSKSIGQKLLVSAKKIFDDKIKNLNPFSRLSNGKVLPLYGPVHEAMDFQFIGHQKHHESMKKAVISLIASHTPKFSDFQKVIYTVVYSQNCEHCLSHLLNPLKSLDSLQKLSIRLTRGVWSPRDWKEMELSVEWLDDRGKKFPLNSWRLNEDIEMPRSSNPSPPLSEEEPPKIKISSRHLETVKKTMELLNGNIKVLGNETEFDKIEKNQPLISKLKALTAGLSMLYMELNSDSTPVSLGVFGFSTGNAEFDKELESAAAKLLSTGREISISSILENLEESSLKWYKNDRLRIEHGILSKITDKLRSVVECNYESESEEYKTKESSDKNEEEKEEEVEIHNAHHMSWELEEDLQLGQKRKISSDSNSSRKKSEPPQKKKKRKRTIMTDSESSGEEWQPYPSKKQKVKLTLKDKLAEVKSKEQRESLFIAYCEAEQTLRDLKNLPAVRKNDVDEFCVFCGVFVINPLPDLSCTFHDQYQQIVNQDFAEKSRRLGRPAKIDRKLMARLIDYLAEQKKKYDEIEDPKPSSSVKTSRAPKKTAAPKNKKKNVNNKKVVVVEVDKKKTKKKCYARKTGQPVLPGDSEDEDSDWDFNFRKPRVSSSSSSSSDEGEWEPLGPVGVKQRLESAIKRIPDTLGREMSRPLWSSRLMNQELSKPALSSFFNNLKPSLTINSRIGLDGNTSSLKLNYSSTPRESSTNSTSSSASLSSEDQIIKRKRGRPALQEKSPPAANTENLQEESVVNNELLAIEPPPTHQECGKLRVKVEEEEPLDEMLLANEFVFIDSSHTETEFIKQEPVDNIKEESPSIEETSFNFTAMEEDDNDEARFVCKTEVVEEEIIMIE